MVYLLDRLTITDVRVVLQLRWIFLQDGEDENVLYLYDKTRPWSPCSLNQLPGLLQHLLNGTTTAKQKVYFCFFNCPLMLQYLLSVCVITIRIKMPF